MPIKPTWSNDAYARERGRLGVSRLLLTLVVLSSVAVAGCGSAAAPRPDSSARKSIRVALTEFRLEPPRATVAAGELSVQVTNRGNSVHALAIETPDGKQATGSIDPGRAATLEAELRPGSYVWYCPVGDHRSRGMEGTITAEGATGGAPSPDDEEERPKPSGGY